MKHTLQFALLLIGLTASTRSNAQTTGIWTQEIASGASNPGPRDSHSGWKDAYGNFWIYGGEINSQSLNDLWKYDPVAGQWTRVSGDSGTYVPGVYGTKGVAAPANKPGARSGQNGWAGASGHFWVFGGYGMDSASQLNMLNDLWEYDTLTKQWTWISGDPAGADAGIYGVKGVADSTNKPGSRFYSSGWSDNAGNVWIFGGYGYDDARVQGVLNDLWKYDIHTGKWTWVSGDSTAVPAGVTAQGIYGTKGLADTANKPPARYLHSAVFDGAGNAWIFGGVDDANSTYNDLWKYALSTNQWTWVSGDNTPNNAGTYGQKGYASTAGEPGARYGVVFEGDNSGHLWLFGGLGYFSSGELYLNDLWGYTIASNQWTWVSGDVGPSPRAFAAGSMDTANNLWVMGGTTQGGLTRGGITQAADNNDLWKFTVLTPLPLQEVSLQGVPQGQGNLLTWQTINELNTAKFIVERSTDGTNFIDVGSVTAVGNGNNDYSYDDAALPAGVSSFLYRLKMTDKDSSFSWSSTIVVHDNEASVEAMVYPNPAHDGATLQLGANTNLLNTPARLVDVSGKIVREYLITSQQQPIDLTNIPQGVYFLKLSYGKTIQLIRN
jgi:N-acetylneuraminic acid mutarotase